MKHGRLLKAVYLLPALMILIVVHGFIFYRTLSHMGLGLAIGFALLVLLKHIGVFGPVYTFFRRRFRQRI